MKKNKFKDFIVINCDGIDVVFSTAENGRSFNRHTEDGVTELHSIKDDFNVDEVAYLRQIHSDYIYNYTGNNDEFIENEGDALFTNVKNTAIGVFTADCVPVIIVDEKTGVIGAAHSGWKGTLNSITLKTLNDMKEKYDISPENTKVFIGPHIRQCCYEVSEELKAQFINKKDIDENVLFDGRNLNMESCIIKDAKEFGIKKENIKSLELCTYCTEKEKLFSYRKSNGTYGRLFAFAYIK
ncbi:MAG: peptidoglycan editing factor PgeF [Clostridium sp.]